MDTQQPKTYTPPLGTLKLLGYLACFLSVVSFCVAFIDAWFVQHYMHCSGSSLGMNPSIWDKVRVPHGPWINNFCYRPVWVMLLLAVLFALIAYGLFTLRTWIANAAQVAVPRDMSKEGSNLASTDSSDDVAASKASDGD